MIVVSQITEVLCDTCYEAVLGLPLDGSRDDDIISICREVGDKLTTHQCEQRTGGLFKFERCVCACDKGGR